MPARTSCASSSARQSARLLILLLPLPHPPTLGNPPDFHRCKHHCACVQRPISLACNRSSASYPIGLTTRLYPYRVFPRTSAVPLRSPALSIGLFLNRLTTAPPRASHLYLASFNARPYCFPPSTALPLMHDIPQHPCLRRICLLSVFLTVSFRSSFPRLPASPCPSVYSTSRSFH